MSARACQEIRADLSVYLDGELEPGAAGKIKVHLESCAACRAEFELLRATVGALRRLPDLPPPAGILTAVRARLRPVPWYRRLLDGRQWLLGFPVGALATVLVVIGITLFQARYPDLEKTVARAPLQPPPSTTASGQAAAPADREMRQQPTTAPSPQPQPTPLAQEPFRESLRKPASVATISVKDGDQRQGGSPTVQEPTSARDDKGLLTLEARGVGAGGKVTMAMSYQSTPSQPSTLDGGGNNSIRQGLSPDDGWTTQRESAAGEKSKVAAANAGRQEQDFAAAAPPTPVTPAQSLSADAPIMPAPPERAAPAAGSDLLEKPQRRLGRATAPSRADDFLPAAKTESMAGSIDGGATRDAHETVVPVTAMRAQEALRAPATDTSPQVLCLLPAADTIDDLKLLLRRENASEIAVVALAPQAILEAFAPHRQRRDVLPEPSRGWTVSARIAPQSLPRLLDALTNRPGVRVLEQPPAAPAGEELPERWNLRITVLQ